jgi:hypothetical protein
MRRPWMAVDREPIVDEFANCLVLGAFELSQSFAMDIPVDISYWLR